MASGIPLLSASHVLTNKEQRYRCFEIVARSCYQEDPHLSAIPGFSICLMPVQMFYMFIKVNSISITQLAGSDVNVVVRSKTNVKSNVNYHTYYVAVDIGRHLEIVEWIVVCSRFVFCCFLTCCSSHSVMFCRHCCSRWGSCYSICRSSSTESGRSQRQQQFQSPDMRWRFLQRQCHRFCPSNRCLTCCHPRRQ